MSFTYLPRQRSLKNLQYNPSAQLVNVPGLYGSQRCPFCHYFQLYRDTPDYRTCQSEHGCGDESLVWAVMRNSYQRRYAEDDHFTPTAIIRQHYFDQVPRYVQLISCDIEGYECNSLCQFYPSRVSEDKSIADCSNTRRCGRNGSFFSLLTVQNTQLYNIPDWFDIAAKDGKFLMLDGSLKGTTPIDSFVYDNSGFVYLVDSAGNRFLFANLSLNEGISGYVLYALFNNPMTWSFRIPVTDPRVDWSNCAILRHSDDATRGLLEEEGMDPEFIYHPIVSPRLLPVTTNVNAWFTLSEVDIEFKQEDFGFVVVFLRRTTRAKYILQLGTGSNRYLYAAREDIKPASWHKSTTQNISLTGYNVITVASFNDPWAIWLQENGVSSTVFNLY